MALKGNRGRLSKAMAEKKRKTSGSNDKDEKKMKKLQPSSRLMTSFKTFIYKLSNKINPRLGFSKKAMSIMNSIVQDYF